MRTNTDILVVDDSDEDATLTLESLRSVVPSASVLRLTDGEEALHFIRGTGGYAGRAKLPPQLVLMELHLPGMDGISVLHNLRARPDMQDLPVVLWTSTRNPRFIELALEAGASAYHVNPPALDEYRAEIDAIVQRWRSQNL